MTNTIITVEQGPVSVVTESGPAGADGVTDYGALTGLPVLGTAAATASTDYATAAQGALAGSAVQPSDDAASLGSGTATDGYVLTADGAGGSAWEAAAVTYAGAASEINAATNKATPVDADEIGIVDSAASWILKKLTWANLKTSLSSVFAVLGGKSGGQTLTGGTGTTDKLVLKGTSGNGTSTAAALEVTVGNNGGISAVRVNNSGAAQFGQNSWLELIDASGGNGNFKSSGVVSFDVVGLLFRNSSSGLAEWMRVGYGVNGIAFPTGYVLVGTTSNDLTNKLQVAGSIAATSTITQLNLKYDSTYYASFTVNSAGALKQTAIGGQTFVGGNGVTSKIILQGTSANGTSTANAIELKVGNNGNTTAMAIRNNGNIYVPAVIENTTSGEGIIFKSPDGTRYKITVANGGALSIVAV